MKKQMPVKSKKPAMHKMPNGMMMKDSDMAAMMKKKGMKH